jgi:hypothetical protein
MPGEYGSRCSADNSSERAAVYHEVAHDPLQRVRYGLLVELVEHRLAQPERRNDSLDRVVVVLYDVASRAVQAKVWIGEPERERCLHLLRVVLQQLRKGRAQHLRQLGSLASGAVVTT